ncbi:hypothetical protein [Segetibacter koreensis]|uniref:hypothetical protein n=1 Tax=Segetibacter koreensis TaxID=398037 RepID=UPI0003629CF9|nr:hypothetical protein [Segetibacter koreensis]
MKKITVMLAIIMIASSYVGKAQIQRGNVLVGGDIANFNLGLNKGSQFSMLIDPKAAWFIRDNTAIGAYAELGLVTGGDAGTTVNYGVGALARQYLSGNALNAVKHTRFFLEGNVGIEGQNISGSGNSTNGLGLGVGPGIAYFITPNIGLEGLLKYRGRVGFGNETTSSNLNLNVGFQIYLPGRTVRQAATNTQ